MLECCCNILFNHPKVFCKKGVFKYLAKLTGNHLCQSFLFNKVDSWGLRLFWKRDSGTSGFTFGGCFCLVVEIITLFPARIVSRTYINIQSGELCNNSLWLKAVQYCSKNLHLRCLQGSRIRLCLQQLVLIIFFFFFFFSYFI